MVVHFSEKSYSVPDSMMVSNRQPLADFVPHVIAFIASPPSVDTNKLAPFLLRWDLPQCTGLIRPPHMNGFLSAGNDLDALQRLFMLAIRR